VGINVGPRRETCPCYRRSQPIRRECGDIVLFRLSGSLTLRCKQRFAGGGFWRLSAVGRYRLVTSYQIESGRRIVL